jgi:hypothetical protein
MLMCRNRSLDSANVSDSLEAPRKYSAYFCATSTNRTISGWSLESAKILNGKKGNSVETAEPFLQLNPKNRGRL